MYATQFQAFAPASLCMLRVISSFPCAITCSHLSGFLCNSHSEHCIVSLATLSAVSPRSIALVPARTIPKLGPHCACGKPLRPGQPSIIQCRPPPRSPAAILVYSVLLVRRGIMASTCAEGVQVARLCHTLLQKIWVCEKNARFR